MSDLEKTQQVKRQTSEHTETSPAEPKMINFMRYRKAAMLLSLVMIVGSIIGIFTKGLNFGIDFTGGTIIEVAYQEPANIDDIRATLRGAGYADAVVQNFGSQEDVLIRLAPRKGVKSSTISNNVMTVLKAKTENIDLRRAEFVGPQVGDELTQDGALSVIYALIGILIYVALRFEFRFSIGSVAALVHDVIITVGFFAWIQAQFDLTVLAAVLAVIGYSLNDTIVVFDRVRENFRVMREGTPVFVTNTAINQMLSRTIMTSFTTLVVLLALFFLGGEIIHGFAMALIVGIVVGTYSSTYVATAIALALGVSKEDLIKPMKEGVDLQAQEEELNRAFLEKEALREAKE